MRAAAAAAAAADDGSPGLLSAAHLAEVHGAKLLPLPISAPELDRYEALWDRGPRPYGYGGTTGIVCTPGFPHGHSPEWGGEYAACPTQHIDPDYIELVGQPCLETLVSTTFIIAYKTHHRPRHHTRFQGYVLLTEGSCINRV